MPTVKKDLGRTIALFEIYGKLLTRKQRAYLAQRYFKDLSLAEIAACNKVSRAAVQDALRHGVREMERFEKVLGLLESRRRDSAFPI